MLYDFIVPYQQESLKIHIQIQGLNQMLYLPSSSPRLTQIYQN